MKQNKKEYINNCDCGLLKNHPDTLNTAALFIDYVCLYILWPITKYCWGFLIDYYKMKQCSKMV